MKSKLSKYLDYSEKHFAYVFYAGRINRIQYQSYFIAWNCYHKIDICRASTSVYKLLFLGKTYFCMLLAHSYSATSIIGVI